MLPLEILSSKCTWILHQLFDTLKLKKPLLFPVWSHSFKKNKVTKHAFVVISERWSFQGNRSIFMFMIPLYWEGDWIKGKHSEKTSHWEDRRVMWMYAYTLQSAPTRSRSAYYMMAEWGRSISCCWQTGLLTLIYTHFRVWTFNTFSTWKHIFHFDWALSRVSLSLSYIFINVWLIYRPEVSTP